MVMLYNRNNYDMIAIVNVHKAERDKSDVIEGK